MSDWAAEFAEAWLKAWNAHDCEAILAHYAEAVRYESPFVAQLQGHPEGRLLGKAAVRSYVAAALERFPTLRFEPIAVYGGAGSLVIEYHSVNGLIAAETFVLDSAHRATAVYCHYRRKDPQAGAQTAHETQ